MYLGVGFPFVRRRFSEDIAALKAGLPSFSTKDIGAEQEKEKKVPTATKRYKRLRYMSGSFAVNGKIGDGKAVYGPQAGTPGKPPFPFSSDGFSKLFSRFEFYNVGRLNFNRSACLGIAAVSRFSSRLEKRAETD